MQGLAIVFLVAILVEAIVENILPITLADGQKWIKRVLALVIAIGVSIAYGIDLFALLGLPAVAWVGPALTGVLISRGAGYLSAIVKRLTVVSAPAQSVDSVPQPADPMPTIRRTREQP